MPPEATLVAMLDEKAKLDPLLNVGQTCIYLKGAPFQRRCRVKTGRVPMRSLP